MALDVTLGVLLASLVICTSTELVHPTWLASTIPEVACLCPIYKYEAPCCISEIIFCFPKWSLYLLFQKLHPFSLLAFDNCILFVGSRELELHLHVKELELHLL